jgi:linoleoyl-CoA desaturase
MGIDGNHPVSLRERFSIAVLMTQTTTTFEYIEEPAAAAVRPAPPRLKFDGPNDFQNLLRKRVDAHFTASGSPQRDVPAMYFKTAVILGLFAASYILLVFFATAWWQALPLAAILGLATAGIGFNIQHDGGHGSYSRHGWINKMMAMTLDVVGGSSYLWHWKHVIFHHTYVNVSGHDTDVDLGPIVRLTPHQKRSGFHRFQHLYIWPLYGFMAIRWHFYSDFLDLATGKMGDQPFPRPRGRDLTVFILGKIVFFTMAFGLPLMFHSVWTVLFFYAVATLLLGMVLSIVFQLAHVVGEADFPLPAHGTGKMDNAWAVHQVETTINFARRSKTLSWLLGGLNFQIEHHLFPKICHVNYPAMSQVVEATCHERDVNYTEHGTFADGLVSHAQWLKKMGNAN